MSAHAVWKFGYIFVLSFQNDHAAHAGICSTVQWDHAPAAKVRAQPLQPAVPSWQDMYICVKVASSKVPTYRPRQKRAWPKSRARSVMLVKHRPQITVLPYFLETPHMYISLMLINNKVTWVRVGVMSAFRTVRMNSIRQTQHQDATNTGQIFTHHVCCIYCFQATSVSYTASLSHPLSANNVCISISTQPYHSKHYPVLWWCQVRI
jgi:hypothetical protein